MRLISVFFTLLSIAACKPRDASEAKPNDNPPPSAQVAAEEKPVTAKADVKSSLVRINSTQQSWNIWQPWEKSPPRKRRALAAVVGPQQVLTTAELVADAITVNNPQGNSPEKNLPVGEAERWLSAFRWTRFCAG